MDSTRCLLAIDAFVNLILGVLLILFPEPLARSLGVPIPESAFYPSILGGVLFGIGVALALECRRPHERFGGLGLGGAVAVNLSGGIVLAAWLVRGVVNMPMRGHVFLWAIAVLLFVISMAEIYVHARCGGKN